MNLRVSACSLATPFSTPLEHRKAVRASGDRIVLLGKRNGDRLNSFFYGLLTVLIVSLLTEPTLVQLRFDSARLHSLTGPGWLVDPPQGRGQLWTRIPPGVLRGGRRSRESTGSTKTTAFRGSILGGSDQADSRLSFVVSLVELILDYARIEVDTSVQCWRSGQ
jgi:hypothetical protein